MIPHAVTIDSRTATVDVMCVTCRKNYTFVFDLQNYIDWMVGKPYPDMDSNARELLSSNQCNSCLDDKLEEMSEESFRDYLKGK